MPAASSIATRKQILLRLSIGCAHNITPGPSVQVVRGLHHAPEIHAQPGVEARRKSPSVGTRTEPRLVWLLFYLTGIPPARSTSGAFPNRRDKHDITVNGPVRTGSSCFNGVYRISVGATCGTLPECGGCFLAKYDGQWQPFQKRRHLWPEGWGVPGR